MPPMQQHSGSCVAPRHRIRAHQDHRAAGSTGPARGTVATDQAADDGGKCHTRSGDQVYSPCPKNRQTRRARRGRRGGRFSPTGSTASSRGAAWSFQHSQRTRCCVRSEDRKPRPRGRDGTTACYDSGHRSDERIPDSATVGANIGSFKSARHFAAWLGLVPRQHSTGGKTRSRSDHQSWQC